MPPAFPRGLILLYRNPLCGEQLPAEDFYLSTHMPDCIAVTQAGQARFCVSGEDETSQDMPAWRDVMDCTGFCIYLCPPLCRMFCVSVMNRVTLHLELPEDLGTAARCCLRMMGLDSRIGSVLSSWHPSAEPGHLLTWCLPAYLGDTQECASPVPWVGISFCVGMWDSAKAYWYLPYRLHPCFCRHRQDMSFLGSGISSE